MAKLLDSATTRRMTGVVVGCGYDVLSFGYYHFGLCLFLLRGGDVAVADFCAAQ